MKRFLLPLLLALLPISAGHLEAAPKGYSFLGDTPLQLSAGIPAGWQEFGFTPAPVRARLLKDTDGFALYWHHYLEPVMKRAAFQTTGRAAALQIRAAKGEYEPLTFTIQGKRQSKLTVAIEDFQGEKSKIAADNCQLRVVYPRPHNNDIPARLGIGNHLADKLYVNVPTLLVREDNLAIEPGINTTLWLTTYVPEDASPGLYRSRIRIKDETGRSLFIPVELRVLSFSLVGSPITLGFYYYDHYGKEPEKRHLELADMADRGFDSIFAPTFMPRLMDNGSLLFDGDIGSWAGLAQDMKKAGMNGPYITDVGYGIDPNVYVRYGWDLGRDPDKLRRAFYPGLSSLSEAINQRAPSGLVLAAATIDEPAFKGRAIVEKARSLSEALKKSGIISYATTPGPCAGINDGAIFHPYLDIECYNGGGKRPEFASAAHRRGAAYWYYANGAMPFSTRLAWGAEAWSLRADGVNSWMYRSLPPERAYRELEAGYPRLYTYPSREGGPLPTLSWEALREGVDDFRYLASLENMIALSAKRGRAKEEARAARKFLDTARQNIFNMRDVYGSRLLVTAEPEYFDYLRMLAALHIERIGSALQGRGHKVMVPPLTEIRLPAVGREMLRDTGLEKLGDAWEVKKSDSRVSAGMLKVAGRSALAVQIPGMENGGSLTLTQDLTGRAGELAGRMIMVDIDLFSEDDYRGVFVELQQFDKNGRPVQEPQRALPAMAIYYFTAIPEPGKWVTRRTFGSISPDASRISLSLTIKGFNMTEKESRSLISIGGVSLKTLQGDLQIESVSAASLSGFSEANIEVPQGKGFPYPLPKWKATGASVAMENLFEDIVLTDNLPLAPGVAGRTGIKAEGRASLLTDGRYDSRHSLVIPSGKAEELRFNWTQPVTVSMVEIRGFEKAEWGYGVLPAELMLDGRRVDGAWQRFDLSGKEPWEASYRFRLNSPLKGSTLSLRLPAIKLERFLNEVYVYGAAEGALGKIAGDAIFSSGKETFIYPADDALKGAKVAVKSVRSSVNSPYSAEKLIDGDLSMNSRWQTNMLPGMLDFDFGKAVNLKAVEMELGSLGWAGKTLPRHLRLFYLKAGKWEPWGEPLLGNIKTRLTPAGLPEVSTSSVRIELCGSWEPVVALIREVTFYGAATDTAPAVPAAAGPLSAQAGEAGQVMAKALKGRASRWPSEGILLESEISGVSYITMPRFLSGDFVVEAEVSHLDSHIGGHMFLFMDSRYADKFPLNERDIGAGELCSIYIADSNVNSPGTPDYFHIKLRNPEGRTLAFNGQEWLTSWTGTKVPWNDRERYRLRAERKEGIWRMTILDAAGKTLVQTEPVISDKMRNGNSDCVLLLGDPWTSYTSGSMVVRKLRVNGEDIDLLRGLPSLPLYKPETVVEALPGIPFYGEMKFGNNHAFLQLPDNYNPATKYPLIVFLHGRGGGTTYKETNLLQPEFSYFLNEVKKRGYIIVAPGYGSDSWMNASGEAIVLEMIDVLKRKLSIDNSRLYMMGVSMGGGASLTFAMRHNKLVTAVCDIMGVTDFARFYNEGFYHPSLSGAYGGSPVDVPAVYRERSALHNIESFRNMPVLIIHGDKDTVVPIWNSELFAQKLQESGGRVEFLRVPGAGHTNAIISGLEKKVLDFFASAR